jgi:hypothetical protein
MRRSDAERLARKAEGEYEGFDGAVSDLSLADLQRVLSPPVPDSPHFTISAVCAATVGLSVCRATRDRAKAID